MQQYRQYYRGWKSRWTRRWTRCVYGLLGIAIALIFTACNPNTRTDPEQTISSLPPLKPFPEVVELSAPNLPDWIEQISPTDEADALVQIRIRFQSPLIPLESLESPSQQALLEKFELVPELPGEFRFLTPRMVGFQGDRALPKATRYKVTLKAGLSDLAEHQLAQDLAWTFTTEPVKLTDLPGLPTLTDTALDPIDLQPALEFTANTALNLKSIEKYVRLSAEGQSQSVALKAALVEAVDLKEGSSEGTTSEALEPSEQFNPDANTRRYSITPQHPLKKTTHYSLAFTPGLRPEQGNIASEEQFEQQLMTYAPLAFEGLGVVGEPGYGGEYDRFVNGLGQLTFNNGLVAESALQEITVDPPPKEAPQLLRAYDDEPLVSLNPWALEPATDYTFTLGAGLSDRFGQTLGKPVTVKYSTGDLSPSLWAPSGLTVFPSNQNLQLNISTVNLPEDYQAAFTPVQPTDLVYADSAYPRENGNLLPAASQWQSITVKNEQNKIKENAIPLADKLSGKTGMLAYGVKARTVSIQGSWQEPSYYGLVQLTNLGVFAQWFPESGLVQVHHLADGSAAIVSIDIYRSQLESTKSDNPMPCATGQTNKDGILRLEAAALKQCMTGGSQFNAPPELLVIAREKAVGNKADNEDWAFVRTQAYSGDYGYGIYADWQGDKPLSRGTIFSDRQLYQPGEVAWFTGVADYLKRGVLTQDKQVAYRVTLEDPDGKKIDLGKKTTNDFGTFSLNWTASKQQPLGNYVISAKGDTGVEIRGDFRVAEFKPPNFKVDLSLDSNFVQRDQVVTAKAQSNYLFGPALQDAKVAYYVTRSPLEEFAPKGWDTFSFGRRWEWPEEKPEVSTDVLQMSKTLSKEGASDLSIPIKGDLPYPMRYRVDAEVADVSNLAVSASQSFTALPSERLIGLQTDFVATAGKAFPVQVMVSDAEGVAIAGQSVTVELQKATYSRVIQVIEGSRTPVDQIAYETVATATVRSKKEAQTVKLTPTESGSYRLQANFSNAKDLLAATDVRLWATGGTPAYWGDRYDNNRLSVQLDKASYEVGETATALIQSPYPEATLSFAVVRHNTLFKTLTSVAGGAPQVQFTVTPDMLPNAAVEAILVRKGAPLETLENPGSLENLSSVGFAPFTTGLKDKYLTVQIKPEQASLKPAEKETLSLSLTDTNNRPVSGQFTVMVVNDAVLQLSGYRLPDLIDTVYAEQPISVRFADNREAVALSPLTSPLAKGWGYGGGLSSSAASTRLRENFQALAYYNGSVLADKNGQAQVSFEVPDNLTTWRVMALATDGNLRFGKSEATFMTTQPLISSPLLPQFMRQGDRLQAGLTVTNTTGQSGTLTLTGQLGEGLHFKDTADTLTQQVKASTGTAAHRFTIVADRPGEGEIEFRTQLGANTDAFKVPLTVKALEITEQVIEAGTTASSVKIPLQVAETTETEIGGLEISLASNLLSNLKMPAQQTLQADYFPGLETLASRIVIASRIKVLSQTYAQTITEIDLTAQIASALAQLQKLQQPDGGFAAWPGAKSADPFVTPYAVSAIAQAKAAGFTVNPSLLERGKPYLSSLLADPGQYDFCQSVTCKNQVRLETLNALAELGDERNQYLAWLYEQRATFDFADQIKLARHLSRFPDWQAESAALASQIQESVYETGRSATVNLPNNLPNNLPKNRSWLNSQTAAQSQALRLFIAREGRPELLSRLVQGLLSQQREGTWQNSYDNAQALSALVEYAQRLPSPPNFETTVQLAGKTLATHAFKGFDAASSEVSVPMLELPRGKSELQLKKVGPGELHYVSAYRYRLQGNPPGRLNGLRITRQLSPVNQQSANQNPANQLAVLHRFGLQPAQEAIALPVGQVFDIGLEIITDHPVDHVIITDPLPAGLEAVDTTFQTTNQTTTGALKAQQDSWEIDYQTIYRDRILAYSDHLEAGVYSLHYLVRSVTPGTFGWPGATAQLQYAPEEFGRCAAATLAVSANPE